MQQPAEQSAKQPAEQPWRWQHSFLVTINPRGEVNDVCMLINANVAQLKSRRLSHSNITACGRCWNSEIIHIFNAVLQWIWVRSGNVQGGFFYLLSCRSHTDSCYWEQYSKCQCIPSFLPTLFCIASILHQGAPPLHTGAALLHNLCLFSLLTLAS